jgi:hypothetical protein
MLKKLVQPLILVIIFASNLSSAQGNQPLSWKFQNDQDNKCVAKYAANSSLELMQQKLTITSKETSDLKSFQVSINEQVVMPMGRANLTDTACKCIRIRNTSALTSNDLNIRIQGQSGKDQPVDVTFNVKDTAMAMQSLKSDVCKSQK